MAYIRNYDFEYYYQILVIDIMKGRHDLSRNCHTYNDELLLVRKHNVCTTLSLARKLFAEYMNDDWQMPAYNLIKTEVKIENWISKLKSPKE